MNAALRNGRLTVRSGAHLICESGTPTCRRSAMMYLASNVPSVTLVPFASTRPYCKTSPCKAQHHASAFTPCNRSLLRAHTSSAFCIALPDAQTLPDCWCTRPQRRHGNGREEQKRRAQQGEEKQNEKKRTWMRKPSNSGPGTAGWQSSSRLRLAGSAVSHMSSVSNTSSTICEPPQIQGVGFRVNGVGFRV
jgi:hypothetical protein